ncbi:uncharacterized protein ANIA_11428 [Aspergillus nidulans FGSC A4]|uniref:Uncharacterized protein n=1 Tax=Emericella nidulans (strain FGSC A4 / ATCC 38163 / CBS 112.46 / NRRL 194 / M139) TaxID=227321 RepID=C8V507_EMENI|nr:hypothetical protein [Aspergillus nidulans FGSC A4]CBF74650.1 TPA: hypothetical protein ANIA_11428 [Aspergillus nidulans FGSC A4]
MLGASPSGNALNRHFFYIELDTQPKRANPSLEITNKPLTFILKIELLKR